MKSILKIMKLYLKKYKALVILLLSLFAIIGYSNSYSLEKNLREGVFNYNFNKTYGYNNFLLNSNAIENEEQFWIEHNKRFDEFFNNYEKKSSYKLQSEDVAKLKSAALLERISSNISLYKNNIYTKSNKLDAEQTQLKQYFTKEQVDSIILLNKYNDNANILSFKKNNITNSEEEKSYEELKAEQRKLAIELDTIFSNYLKINATKSDLLELMNYNLANDNSDLSVKEYYYSDSLMFIIMITTILVPAFFFGLEYHTTFGKFVAALPFKKIHIFYAKLIVSIAVLTSAYVILGLINIFVIKGGVLANVVSVPTAFFAYSKVYFLSVCLVLLGAIFASFSGSIISIVALYLPGLMFIGYFLILYFLNMKIILPINNDIIIPVNNNIIIPGEKSLSTIFTADNPLYIPWRMYFLQDFAYYYYIIYFIVLVLLIVLASFIYKNHNIDKEGYFFTYKTANIICYIISSISFATLITSILSLNNISVILAYLIAYSIVLPIILLLFKIKIRI